MQKLRGPQPGGPDFVGDESFEFLLLHVAPPAGIARGPPFGHESSEARLLCRKPSAEIERLLGYAAEPEMLHRDNLVLTR